MFISNILNRVNKTWSICKVILDEGIWAYLEQRNIFKETKEVVKTPLEIIMEKIDSIDISCFNQVSHPKYRLLEIKVLFHNINRYNNEIGNISALLKQGFVLENKYKSRDPVTIYLVKFFINSKGEYIDRDKSIETFKNVARDLIAYYYDHLNEVNDYSIKFNVRMLKFIIQNLEEVINSLSLYCREVTNERRRK